ncbi:DUF6446 family protein [Pontivivens insulae]|uniref:Histidine kinase n=1 Tax=Pontivivens insulae TaxID=1639689 RepID=A0A2R8ACZ0_9RHOB|nr:DUF6446 family protein [Pontivivens insulae]RED13866.1 hypothetical protein DFR53_1212 [Pontivivens insulae]SPF29940.1 hypothetical protein POI8812_02266 [Pontivivens insulae]
MNGKLFMSLFVGFALIFGVALWYFQVYAFYEETEADSVMAGGVEIPVTDWRGIDADTSPNKLRACFTVDPADFTDLPPAPNPDPLVAPGWFDCFEAEQIASDLEAGLATAYLAGDETPEGAFEYEILRFIAVYPDGRAYLWRHYRES